jgi:hypothetical protein
VKIANIETFIVWGGANDSTLRKNFQEKNFCFVVDTDEGMYGVGEAGRKGPYRPHEIQHVTRRDGSVANW